MCFRWPLVSVAAEWHYPGGHIPSEATFRACLRSNSLFLSSMWLFSSSSVWKVRPRNTVGEARESQVFIEGIDFLTVMGMLTGNLGPDLVQLPHNLIFQCRDLL